jgi:glucan 1,3-beta-glucosidase
MSVAMKHIKGVNIGNWLVLEKWMAPDFFNGTNSEDEVWLNRTSDFHVLQEKMRKHRDTYVTERDFKYLAELEVKLIRIPIPYFIFGDKSPFIGCIGYLDQAFEWAEKYGQKILIDLHTVPGSQNGYDNGGLTGVCKWHKNKEEVNFVLSVLDRLAKRYSMREALYGVEVLNEPISWSVWMTSPNRKQSKSRIEAKGSGHVSMKFLKQFYKDAYKVLRGSLPKEKVIVFHDGFRLSKWKDFFVKENMINVVLDTHIYLIAMDNLIKFSSMKTYRLYLWWCRRQINKASRYTPVIIGEWCVANNLGIKQQNKEPNNRKIRDEINKKIATIQLATWESSAGWIYWSYQLQKDSEQQHAREGLEEWDFRICKQKGWLE